MLGYVQLSPRGEPIPPALFSQSAAASQFGALGGPVDCVIDIGSSGQLMRVSRVDVNASTDGAGQPIFVSAARGVGGPAEGRLLERRPARPGTGRCPVSMRKPRCH